MYCLTYSGRVIVPVILSFGAGGITWSGELIGGNVDGVLCDGVFKRNNDPAARNPIAITAIKPLRHALVARCLGRVPPYVYCGG
jgi:hypothetical protein